MTPEQVPYEIAEIAARGRYKVYSDTLPFLGPWEELPEDYRKASVDVMRAPLAAVLGEHAALILEAEAADFDRGVNERCIKDARADVRCSYCGLRYGEREEYGCEPQGRSHHYSDEELNEVGPPLDAPTFYGDQLRHKAAEYREGKRP